MEPRKLTSAVDNKKKRLRTTDGGPCNEAKRSKAQEKGQGQLHLRVLKEVARFLRQAVGGVDVHTHGRCESLQRREQRVSRRFRRKPGSNKKTCCCRVAHGKKDY